MAYKSYERGTTIKITAEFKSSGQYADPLYPRVNVYKPDGSKLIDNAIPFKSDTGRYYYYIETSSNAMLGLYMVEWIGWSLLGGSLGSGQIVQREVFQLIEVKEG